MVLVAGIDPPPGAQATFVKVTQPTYGQFLNPLLPTKDEIVQLKYLESAPETLSFGAIQMYSWDLEDGAAYTGGITSADFEQHPQVLLPIPVPAYTTFKPRQAGIYALTLFVGFPGAPYSPLVQNGYWVGFTKFPEDYKYLSVVDSTRCKQITPELGWTVVGDMGGTCNLMAMVYVKGGEEVAIPNLYNANYYTRFIGPSPDLPAKQYRTVLPSLWAFTVTRLV